MGFANFFDRSATAASQVLANFRLEDFKDRLSAHAAALSFDDAAVDSSEGRATLDLSVRLLARLYPALTVHPIGSRPETTLPIFEDSPAASTTRSTCKATSKLPAPSSTSARRRRRPGSTPSTSARTDGARCCRGTARSAQVRRRIRSEPAPPPASEPPTSSEGSSPTSFPAAISTSGSICRLSTYLQGSAAVSALPERCDLGDAYLVGLGAIGNGAVWALSRVPGLAGVLHLVDHENADLSNLQRYVMITQDDVGRRKVRLARASFTQGTLKVRAQSPTMGRLCRRSPQSAPSNGSRWRWTPPRDRIALQASLPKWIVNAWTQNVDLGVSRHDFATAGACLACLYMPTARSKTKTREWRRN